MAPATVTVRGDDDLAAVRQAYLEAVQDGRRELVVELPAGCLGLDGGITGLSLADVGASGPPDLDVSITAPDGLCVLAGTSVAVSARRVRIAGVAIAGGPPAALRIGVRESLELEDVTLLGVPAHHREGSTVTLQASAGGAEARLRSVVLGHCAAADALLAASCLAGAWWQTLELDGVVARPEAADAVVAMDSVASLRLRDCALAAGPAKALLTMLVAPTEGEIARTRLSARAGALANVVHEDPARPLALRLADGVATTVPAGELPPGFEGEAEEVAGATVEAEIAAAVDRARERVVATDARLGQRLP
jgi:hypothetical protein